MFRKFAVILPIITVALLSGIQALAAPTVSLSFVMPQGVDPPYKKFLNNSSVPVTSTELAPGNGVELHGRPLNVMTDGNSSQLLYMDVTEVVIQFVYTGKISVKSSVAQGFNGIKPWLVQTSFEKLTETWTVRLTAQAGSVLLSDWDLTGGSLPQGFFASLTASQGTDQAPITDVTVTPVHFTMNANQRPSHDVSDVTAPTIGATVDKPQIWSPDKKPVNVALTAALQDTPTEDANNYISLLNPSSVSVSLTQVDGSVTTQLGSVPFKVVYHGDGSIGLSAALSLISTRNGTNVEGRIYYLTISARDFAGNLAQSTVTVTVTHDQGQ